MPSRPSGQYDRTSGTASPAAKMSEKPITTRTRTGGLCTSRSPAFSQAASIDDVQLQAALRRIALGIAPCGQLEMGAPRRPAVAEEMNHVRAKLVDLDIEIQRHRRHEIRGMARVEGEGGGEAFAGDRAPHSLGRNRF